MASLTKSDSFISKENSSRQKDLEKLKKADTTKRMKRLRKAVDDGEAKEEMSHYPRTKKERKTILRHEECDAQFQTFLYPPNDVNETPTMREKNIIDCLKVGLKYIPEPSDSVKTIQYLNKKRGGRSGRATNWDSLPIYWINGHSNIEIKIELKPPPGMPDDEVEEEMEYDFISQLLSDFSINRVSPSVTKKSPAPSDFFTTPEGVFIAVTTPVGYDATCGDWRQKKFLAHSHLFENFSILREILLSDKYKELFKHNNPDMMTCFTPPHYSAMNKTYQFFDVISKKDGKQEHSYDKWGVIKLDQDAVEMGYDEFNNCLNTHTPPITINSIEDQISALNTCVGFNKQLDSLIKRSVREHFDVSLKDIVKILGPGIYLDAGCCGLSVKIYDSSGKGSWHNFGPDTERDFREIQPIYDCIMDDFDIMRTYQKLAWDNIVTKEGEELFHDLSREEKIIIYYSNFNADPSFSATSSISTRMKTQEINEGEKVELKPNEMPVRLVEVPYSLRSKFTEDGERKRGGNKKKKKGLRKTKNKRKQERNTRKRKKTRKQKGKIKKGNKMRFLK